MAMQISGETAQRIVESVRDISGCDINFFQTDGIIYASTDRKRIGDFHEIAAEVVRTGNTIEIREGETYIGTRKGVNMPILHHKRICGVIGISGNPDEVRKYAHLAQRIVRIILREQELESSNYSRRMEVNYLIQTLLGEREEETAYIDELLAEQELIGARIYRTVILREVAQGQQHDPATMEQEIYHLLDEIPEVLYTYSYPDRFLALIPEEEFLKAGKLLEKLLDRYEGSLKAGVGQAAPLNWQKRSYETAQMAIRSSSRGYACYDDMDLEILLGAVPERVRDSFAAKVAGNLEESDIELLTAYFANNRSLEQTGKALFLHKNTLQYRLNRIAERTGYNPRNYEESVVLYLAIK